MLGLIRPFISLRAFAIAVLVVIISGLLGLLPLSILGQSILYYVVLFLSFYFAALFVLRFRPTGRTAYILVGLIGAVVFGAFYNFGMRFSGKMIGIGIDAFPSLIMGILHFFFGFISVWIVSKFGRW